VAEWIATQPVGGPPASSSPESGPTEPTILHAAIDYLAARDRGRSPAVVVAQLTERYPRPVLDALVTEESRTHATAGVPCEVTVADLRLGMLLQQDVQTTTGMMLVRAGERLDETLLARLRNFARSTGVVEPIRVLA
jgi:hypothetical protein